MKPRLSPFRVLLKKNKLDSYLVAHQPNIRYLTGFPAEESWLLVTLKSAFYITDFRYALEVKKGLKGIPIKQFTRSVYETFSALVKEQKLKKIGYEEDRLSVSQLNRFRQAAGRSRSLKKAGGLIESLREVKEDNEIRKIKKALKVHEESFKFLKRLIRPGLSELDALLKLEQFVKSRKCGFSFDPIVASGSNSCYPHAKVTSRVFKRNDYVLVDWGIDFQGYKSDLTRMFFLGKIPKLVRTVNDTVVQAQKKAVDFIKPNVPIAQVDYQARNYLEKQRLAKYFGHGLGHGVGLEIHEAPRLSPQSKLRLKPGMVITIEPAVYLPNKFGIRIEDMVLVTEKGAKVLSAHIY